MSMTEVSLLSKQNLTSSPCFLYGTSPVPQLCLASPRPAPVCFIPSGAGVQRGTCLDMRDLAAPFTDFELILLVFLASYPCLQQCLMPLIPGSFWGFSGENCVALVGFSVWTLIPQPCPPRTKSITFCLPSSKNVLTLTTAFFPILSVIVCLCFKKKKSTMAI